MGCYHPHIRVASKWNLTDNLKPKTAYFIKNYNIKNYEDFPEEDENFIYQKVPCGKCTGCRLKQASEWANRCMLEAEYSKNNYFLTLTYDEEHKPYRSEYEWYNFTFYDDGTWNGYLIKKDLSDFIKALRNRMAYIYDKEGNLRDKKDRDKKGYDGIRFFGVGEYGEKGHRPHYHIILFNMPELQDLELIGIDPETHLKLYTSNEITKIWGKGFISIGSVTKESCDYVARYNTKKLWGKEIIEYAKKGQEPEFSLCSRNPGIGKKYYQEHKEEIYEDDKILIRKANRGVFQKPPGYFDRLYDNDNHENFEVIKERRREQARRLSEEIKREQSLPEKEYLMVKERTVIQNFKQGRERIKDVFTTK